MMASGGCAGGGVVIVLGCLCAMSVWPPSVDVIAAHMSRLPVVQCGRQEVQEGIGSDQDEYNSELGLNGPRIVLALWRTTIQGKPVMRTV